MIGTTALYHKQPPYFYPRLSRVAADVSCLQYTWTEIGRVHNTVEARPVRTPVNIAARLCSSCRNNLVPIAIYFAALCSRAVPMQAVPFTTRISTYKLN